MGAATLVTSLLALGSVAAANPIDKRQARDFGKFDYANNKVRGVNLGGWFVLEPWITPSIFEAQPDSVVDEYTLCKTIGADACVSLLTPHWDTWITEDDFRQIAAAGMNHVRIPIGYWSVQPNQGDPYVQGAYPFLGRALDWAQGQNIKVMIDIHGAPLSQNGFDNSGQRGGIGFAQGDSYSQLLNVLSTIKDDHADHPAVASIQIVNEPMAPVIGQGTIEQLYRDGWGRLSDKNVYTSIHDGFLGPKAWDKTFDAGMTGMVIDTHHYEVFDNGQLKLSPTDHNNMACDFGSQMASNSRPTIAGEWTGALTDCTKWLNGRGKGVRYDGTFDGNGAIGSCDGKYSGDTANLSQADKDNSRNFINAQLDAFEKKSGWIFWTWRTEASPEWDMQKLLANGIFPNPVTSRNGFRCP